MGARRADSIAPRPTCHHHGGRTRRGVEAPPATGQAPERNPYVERFDMAVSVIDGTAYLTGVVDSYSEKSQADETAAAAAGVAEVRNQLDVDHDRGSLAWDVRALAESETWSRS